MAQPGGQLVGETVQQAEEVIARLDAERAQHGERRRHEGRTVEAEVHHRVLGESEEVVGARLPREVRQAARHLLGDRRVADLRDGAAERRLVFDDAETEEREVGAGVAEEVEAAEGFGTVLDDGKAMSGGGGNDGVRVKPPPEEVRDEDGDGTRGDERVEELEAGREGRDADVKGDDDEAVDAEDVHHVGDVEGGDDHLGAGREAAGGEEEVEPGADGEDGEDRVRVERGGEEAAERRDVGVGAARRAHDAERSRRETTPRRI